MKLTYSKIIELIIYIIVLLNLYVNYFFNISMSSPVWITMVLSTVCLVLTILATRKWNKVDKAVFRFSNIYIMLTIVVVFIEFIYSMFKYGQKFGEVMACANSYFYLLLLYPLIYLFKCRGVNKVLKNIMWITFIVLFAYLLQAMLYNIKGIILWDKLVNTEWVRNGKLRLGTTCLGAFVSLYSFYLYLTEENKKKYLYCILAVFSIIYCTYVNQGRIVSMSLAGAYVFMYLYKKRSSVKQIIVVITFVIGLCICLNSSTFSDFVGSFSLESEMGGGSTYARLISINYYFENEDWNNVLGMGFIADNTTERYLILHRTIGSDEAYYSDLGVLGLYFNIGLCSLIVFGMFYGRLIYAILKGCKVIASEKVLVSGMGIYITISSVSLLLFSASGVLAVPFFMSVIEIFIHKNFVNLSEKYIK